MSPRFHALTRFISTLIGVFFLSANALQAEAGQLKAAPDIKICRKNSLLQSAFFKQIENICLKTEKPISESNYSEQDSDNGSDQTTPDKPKEESNPTSTPNDSHDLNLFIQLSPGGGSSDSFSNGFTSPEPMKAETAPVKPSPKIPKKTKGTSKPQKLVFPTLNRNQLLPQKSIKPIIPKTPLNIKSIIVPTKSLRPIILKQPAPALRIRSVQPVMRQNLMINRGVSRPVQRRSK